MSDFICSCTCLDVLCPLQEPVIEPADVVVLLQFNFEVYKRLPQHFGHVEEGLSYGELVDGTSPVDIVQNRFKFGKLKYKIKQININTRILCEEISRA